MLAREDGQAHDCVLVNADQPAGLEDATTLLQLLEDRNGLVLGQLTVEQRGAFALGEALLAGAADKHAGPLGAVAEAHAEVVAAALAVVGASGVEAAEGFQFVHGASHPAQGQKKGLPPDGIILETTRRDGNTDRTRPKFAGGTLSTPVMAPNGTRFGGWLLNTADNHLASGADYDGDHSAEILATSPWGMGILKLVGSNLTSPTMSANGSRFHGWLLNTDDNDFGHCV